MKKTMRKATAPLLCSASLFCLAGLSVPTFAQGVISSPPPAVTSKIQTVQAIPAVKAAAIPRQTPQPPASSAKADADIALNSSVDHQDGAKATKPAIDASKKDAAKKDALTVEEKRKLLDVDPSVVEAVKAFDRDKFISTRETINKDTIVIQQDIERAAAIKKLLKLYGVTAFAAAYPDLYEQIKDSPMVLAAKIDMQKSKNDLDAALNPPDLKKPEKVAASNTNSAVLPPRNDGSQFFSMPGAAQPSIGPNANLSPKPKAGAANASGVPTQKVPTLMGTLPAPAIAPADKLGQDGSGDGKAAPAKKAKPVYRPISLREIFGTGNKFKAIVVVGEDRWQIKSGDTLDDGTIVKSVNSESVVIDRDGKDLTLQIGG